MENFMGKSSPDKKRQKTLSELEGRLVYSFRDITFLEIALTHSSYVNENPQLATADNERFEFLGDAVLGACVSDLLIKKYTDFSEGTLSKVRAAVVNEKPLAEIARKLKIGDFLLLGKGEEISGGRTKASLLANALEAVIAAIYLDAGFTKTKSVIKKLTSELLQEDNLHSQCLDYKTALQEACQQRYKTAPTYTLLDTSGPDHAKTFEIKVTINDHIVQIGSGRSKKEAEKQAARKAWEFLQNEKE
jgi:ribonuclease III